MSTISDAVLRDLALVTALGELLERNTTVDASDIFSEDEIARINAFVDALPDADATMSARTIELVEAMLRDAVERLLVAQGGDAE